MKFNAAELTEIAGIVTQTEEAYDDSHAPIIGKIELMDESGSSLGSIDYEGDGKYMFAVA